MTQILAARSAFPAYRYPQADITEAVASIAGIGPAREGGARAAGGPVRTQRALLERLHANAGVETRHTVFPLADYDALGAIPNDRYIEEATALGERALRAALAESGLAAADLDLLIVTSVTGVAVPSIDALLMPRLGLRPDVKRLPVFGLGCVAGAAGLARLHDYLLAWPGHAAALLAVELCSLSLPRHPRRQRSRHPSRRDCHGSSRPAARSTPTARTRSAGGWAPTASASCSRRSWPRWWSGG